MSSSETLKRKHNEEAEAIVAIFEQEREKAKRRLAEIDESEKRLTHATEDIRLTLTAFNTLLDQLSDIYKDTPRELLDSVTTQISQLKAEGLRLARQLGTQCPGIDGLILDDLHGSDFKEMLAKKKIDPGKQPDHYVMRNRELWGEYRHVLRNIEDQIHEKFESFEEGKRVTIELGFMTPECAELVARVINIEQHVRYTPGECMYCISRREHYRGFELIEKEKIKHVTYSWSFFKQVKPKE